MAWIKDRKETIKEAVGIKRVLVGTTITAALAILAWVRGLPSMTWLESVPTWPFMVIIPLGMLAWWLLGYATDKRKDALPRLSIEYDETEPFVITEPFNSSAPARRLIRVRVRNLGNEELNICLVKLEEMLCDGKSSNAFTPIGMITQHHAIQEKPGGVFHLRGKEPKFIEIASLDESDNESEIQLHYETDHYPSKIPRNEYELMLSAYGGPCPVQKRFKLYVDGGRLRMREVNGTR